MVDAKKPRFSYCTFDNGDAPSICLSKKVPEIFLLRSNFDHEYSHNQPHYIIINIFRWLGTNKPGDNSSGIDLRQKNFGLKFCFRRNHWAAKIRLWIWWTKLKNSSFNCLLHDKDEHQVADHLLQSVLSYHRYEVILQWERPVRIKWYELARLGVEHHNSGVEVQCSGLAISSHQ